MYKYGTNLRYSSYLGILKILQTCLKLNIYYQKKVFLGIIYII